MCVHFLAASWSDNALFEFPPGAISVDTSGKSNGHFENTDGLDAHLSKFLAAYQDLNHCLSGQALAKSNTDHARDDAMDLVRFRFMDVATNRRPTTTEATHTITRLYAAIN